MNVQEYRSFLQRHARLSWLHGSRKPLDDSVVSEILETTRSVLAKKVDIESVAKVGENLGFFARGLAQNLLEKLGIEWSVCYAVFAVFSLLFEAFSCPKVEVVVPKLFLLFEDTISDEQKLFWIKYSLLYLTLAIENSNLEEVYSAIIPVLSLDQNPSGLVKVLLLVESLLLNWKERKIPSESVKGLSTVAIVFLTSTLRHPDLREKSLKIIRKLLFLPLLYSTAVYKSEKNDLSDFRLVLLDFEKAYYELQNGPKMLDNLKAEIFLNHPELESILKAPLADLFSRPAFFELLDKASAESLRTLIPEGSDFFPSSLRDHTPFLKEAIYHNYLGFWGINKTLTYLPTEKALEETAKRSSRNKYSDDSVFLRKVPRIHPKSASFNELLSDYFNRAKQEYLTLLNADLEEISNRLDIRGSGKDAKFSGSSKYALRIEYPTASGLSTVVKISPKQASEEWLRLEGETVFLASLGENSPITVLRSARVGKVEPLAKNEANLYLFVNEEKDDTPELLANINAVIRGKKNVTHLGKLMGCSLSSNIQLPDLAEDAFVKGKRDVVERAPSLILGDLFLSKEQLLELLDSDSKEFKDSYRENKRRRIDQEPSFFEVVQSEQGYEIQSSVPPSFNPLLYENPKYKQIKYDPSQATAVYQGLNHGISMISGPPGSGKSQVLARICSGLLDNFPEEKTLVVVRSPSAVKSLYYKIQGKSLSLDIFGGFDGFDSLYESVILFFLKLVDSLAASLGIEGYHGSSCETATYFYEKYIIPKLENLEFHFKKFFEDLQISGSEAQLIGYLKQLFAEIKRCQAFETLKSPSSFHSYLANSTAKVVIVSVPELVRNFSQYRVSFNNLIYDDSGLFTGLESLLPLFKAHGSLKRVIFAGDASLSKPWMCVDTLKRLSEVSPLCEKIKPTIVLENQYRSNELFPIISSRYGVDLPAAKLDSISFKDIKPKKGAQWNMFQNLAEAEYAITELSKVEASQSAAILTFYEAQKYLILEILKQKSNRPVTVATIDEFQGCEASVVILSVVETKLPVLLLDPSTMTCAFSRARHRLVVLGSNSVLNSIESPVKNMISRMRTMSG